MAEGWVTCWVLAVVFAAALVRSALGFGEALVAVPLLALIVPVGVAAPLAVLLSITVAAAALAQDWRGVRTGSAWRLVLATLPGVPLGVLLLKFVPGRAVKAALAVAILAFSSWCLARRARPALRDDRLAWGFGFAAGVLGGACAMNGPPLAVYGALRGWPAAEFRATLQAYFLPASLAGLAWYWAAGLWVPSVTRYYLLSLPLVAVAIVAGRAVNRRIDAGSFVAAVHVALLLIAAALLAQSAWGE
jgi:uncharacterized membrane protein YfcA